MRKVRLDRYLKGKLKKEVAAECGVSPAMISKAMLEMNAGGRDYFVQTWDGGAQLVRKNPAWTVITGK